MRKPISLFVLLLFLSFSSAGFAGDPFLGASVYSEHCAYCHGANGKAVIAGTPDFMRNMQLLAKPDMQIMQTIKGGKGLMPAFGGLLKDNQIMDVITYIRTFN